jgi:hypothetical protein
VRKRCCGRALDALRVRSKRGLNLLDCRKPSAPHGHSCSGGGGARGQDEQRGGLRAGLERRPETWRARAGARGPGRLRPVHCGRLCLPQARAPCCERIPRAAAGCFVRCAAGCEESRRHCAQGDKRLCALLREGQPLWGARASRRVTGAGCARSMPSAFTATLLDLLARFPQLRVILVSQVCQCSHPRPRSGEFADPAALAPATYTCQPLHLAAD